jgi:hypothetical protein
MILPRFSGTTASCARAIIEERHEAHDETVAAFRDELDKGMP